MFIINTNVRKVIGVIPIRQALLISVQTAVRVVREKSGAGLFLVPKYDSVRRDIQPLTANQE
jgi:hypothetical protein